jgi:hypothetical protein
MPSESNVFTNCVGCAVRGSVRARLAVQDREIIPVRRGRRKERQIAFDTSRADIARLHVRDMPSEGEAGIRYFRKRRELACMNESKHSSDGLQGQHIGMLVDWLLDTVSTSKLPTSGLDQIVGTAPIDLRERGDIGLKGWDLVRR